MDSSKKAAEITLSKRNSSIELIKVIALLLIVCSHVIGSLGGTSEIAYTDYIIHFDYATTNSVQIFITLIRSLCFAANAIFFICSAWFLIDSSKTNLSKIILMLVDCWIISVGILAVVLVLRNGDISAKLIIKSLFPTTFSNNWYLTCYLIFHAIHPALNSIINKMSQASLLKQYF